MRRRASTSASVIMLAVLLLLLADGPAVSAHSPTDVAQPEVSARSLRSAEGDSASWPYGPATWIRIPRIGVDSPVSDVGVQNGEYGVPWWEVGRHADSANPGAVGNSIYNGHVDTINAGRVFARLQELTIGDAIYIYTPTHRLDWYVAETMTVPNTNNDFIRPTKDARVTLYTCTGYFNPFEQNFSDRLVVVGKFMNLAPLSDG